MPNPFYRVKRAPIVTGPFDFDNPRIGEARGLRDALTDAAIDRDAAAFITFLDRQKQTNLRKGAGVQGYCFSGPSRSTLAPPDPIAFALSQLFTAAAS